MSKRISSPEQSAIRFWSMVDRRGPDECWLWTRSGTGVYGQFYPSGNERVYAHRYAYELVNGPVPDGLYVCHDCPGGDNPLCCNPAHLFAGTPTANVQDSLEKGRAVVGERAHTAKLSRHQVQEIRFLVQRGQQTFSHVARLYGVGTGAIRDIAHGVTWKWLPYDESVAGVLLRNTDSDKRV